MMCPVCRDGMLVVEYRDVEVDYCLACRGIWFDSGEFELLLADVGLQDVAAHLSNALRAAGKRKEGPRRCSICRKKMDKVVLGTEPGVLIDRCVMGHGMWFDSGELRRALREFAGEDVKIVNEVLSFLKETLPREHKKEGSNP